MKKSATRKSEAGAASKKKTASKPVAKAAAPNMSFFKLVRTMAADMAAATKEVSRSVSAVTAMATGKVAGKGASANKAPAKKPVAKAAPAPAKAAAPMPSGETVSDLFNGWTKKTDKKIAAFQAEVEDRIARAFDMCVATVEQAVNIMEARLSSVLGQMDNLVSGAKPKFSNGRLSTVVSKDGTERTEYTYNDDGTVVSRVSRNGVLKYRIVHDSFGRPQSGKMYNAAGQVVKEFNYGPDGQVK